MDARTAHDLRSCTDGIAGDENYGALQMFRITQAGKFRSLVRLITSWFRNVRA